MKQQLLFKTSFAALLCVLCIFTASAANIIIKGAVKDKTSKEPLIGATIRLLGTPAGAITDVDGNFELTGSGISSGIYDLEIKYVGYKTHIQHQLNVAASKSLLLELELEADAVQLSDVIVVAKKNRGSENMGLLEQKKSVMAVQSVSVAELSRKGVSDAETALTKVSGISKQEGVKNVFVRGLGDRYNATTFNGFAISSEDPEYKNISLDIFGTDIIQSIGVNKVFNAQGRSDVGGAAIDIVSKELIDDRLLNFSVSGGVNTQTVGKNFYQADGVNLFGIAEGAEPNNDNKWGFKNSLDPSRQHLQLDRSYHFSLGKRLYFSPKRNMLTFFLTAGHSVDYNYTKETLRNTTTSGTIYKDMTGDKYSQNISQLLLGSVEYGMLNGNKVTYNLMLIHANTQSVGDYNGRNSVFDDDFGNEGFTRRQQVNDNLLLVNQIRGNYKLSNSLHLDAGASYNRVKGNEPDRRINNLTRSDGGYSLVRGNFQQRYFSTLTENDYNVRAALIYKLKDNLEETSNVRLGYTGRFVKDKFRATEYNLTVGHSSLANSPYEFSFDDYYNDNNFAANWFDVQKNVDTYSVTKNIHSAYVEATYQFAPKWIVNLGLKNDNVHILVDYNVNKGGSLGSNAIDKNFILPSLNLKYNLHPKHSIRLGASKTYTLPQAKEISPYRYVGENFNSQGNANLKPSDNYNADLKWDFNPSPSELISVTGFYKLIKHPISRIEVASAGGYLSYENIADRATVAGVEVELRNTLPSALMPVITFTSPP